MSLGSRFISNVSLFHFHMLFLILALCLMVVKRLCISRHHILTRSIQSRKGEKEVGIFSFMSAFLLGRKILKRALENSLPCLIGQNWVTAAAAVAAKSFQSCPTLCDPRDGSPPGSPVPGILQARTLEWVAISFSNA